MLGDLSSQRETITRARERMRQADTDLNRSHKVLSLMIRRYIFLYFLLFHLFLSYAEVFFIGTYEAFRSKSEIKGVAVQYKKFVFQ